MIETDRAWAAGFFDGEGWIGTWQPANPARRQTLARRISLTLDQVDPEVLDRFKAIMGVGSVSTARQYRRDRQPHYRYSAVGLRSVRLVVDAIWPYLGTKKRNQARLAFARYSALGAQLDQRFASVRRPHLIAQEAMS